MVLLLYDAVLIIFNFRTEAMSGYGDRSAYPEHGDAYWGDQAPQSTYNFDMTGNNFGQEL